MSKIRRLLPRIKQFFCRHRYADKNLAVGRMDEATDTVIFRNYCVRCGKHIEICLPYRSVFWTVDREIAVRAERLAKEDRLEE